MAGSGWQSSDLLTRFNQMAGRPASDKITDPLKYVRIADAQEVVLMEVARVDPKSLFGAPTAMTSSDGGYTFTFGTDGNGYAVFPMGARIYPYQSAVPFYPWTPGVDYLDEGTQIRMPNNQTWSGTLYWQGISLPQQISASVQPVIQPPPSRILIVIKAVQSFAEEFVKNEALADRMQIRWNREWPTHITAIRKHLRGRRGLGPLATAVGRDGAGVFGFGGFGVN